MTERPTVILAAGDFPSRGSEPERLLLSAAHVVACDSAAESFYRRFHRLPDVVVGDFDSLGDVISHGDTKTRSEKACEFVKIEEQETNDLDKAIRHCRAKGWNDLVIVGATGKREDHTIGNVYRALAAEVPVVSEYGAFHPVRGRLTLRVLAPGTGISVFASDPATKMTSQGLEWPLAGVKFTNPYCATLNRASSETVVVTSDRPAFVYEERIPLAVRAVVSLGSNVGDRADYLRRALAALAELPKTRLLDASAVRETEPVGVPPEFADQLFLNQAAVFETLLDPLMFLHELHGIEDALGRVRTVRNGPRTIDLDLVLYGDVTMKTKTLTLPHPRAKERAFVVEPLKELGVEL